MERKESVMRKLFSLVLAFLLAFSLAGARAGEEAADLTGDWVLSYDVNDTEILQYVYLYEDNTFEILDDETDESEPIGTGRWTFDGEELTLTLEDGDTLSLAWDADAFRLTGEYSGIPAVMRLPDGSEAPEDPGAEEAEEAEDVPSGRLAGGWTNAADPTVTEHVAALVATVLEEQDGLSIMPVAYLGSQVVAGTNHAILCQTAPVVPDPVPSWVILYLYEDLQGNVSVLDIEPLELGV